MSSTWAGCWPSWEAAPREQTKGNRGEAGAAAESEAPEEFEGAAAVENVHHLLSAKHLQRDTETAIRKRKLKSQTAVRRADAPRGGRLGSERESHSVVANRFFGRSRVFGKARTWTKTCLAPFSDSGRRVEGQTWDEGDWCALVETVQTPSGLQDAGDDKGRCETSS